MAEPAYPDLVFQKPHQVGLHEPKSFEDTLRDLLRRSPYLFISFAVHFLLALAFITGDPSVPKDKAHTIIASPEEFVEPPPPPPPPPPPEIEKEVEPIVDPVISETDTTDVEEIPTESLVATDTTDSANDVIGVGGGGLGSGPGGKIGRRGGSGGGNPHDESVELALRWLANHQSIDDGHWSCAAFDDECGKLGDDTICDGVGNPQFDVGVSSLALLAFLGAGHTNTEGKYKLTVRNGLKFLAEVQSADGNFGVESRPLHTYDHLIATLAMVEACALTGGNRLFKGPAEKGLKHMYAIRNPNAAWRYPAFSEEMQRTGKFNDMSVTGWAIMSMTMAKDYGKYGLTFDKTALEDAMIFLEEMTDPVSGRTGYFDRGGTPAREGGYMMQNWDATQSESMTAVGVLCRIFADPMLARPGNKAMIDKGVKLMLDLPPVWKDGQEARRDFYYWYYGTYALYQVGGDAWKKWEATITPAIANHQHKTGERAGSWDPQEDPWGGMGGRVYSTALLCLTLEVFNRYDHVIGGK